MQYTVSLKLNHVFQQLYRRGARSAAPTLALYSRPNGRDHNRLGLTTGAKLGHAVVRNRVRRRFRELYRLHKPEMQPGYDVILVARGRAVRSTYQQLDETYLHLLRQAGLVPEETA